MFGVNVGKYSSTMDPVGTNQLLFSCYQWNITRKNQPAKDYISLWTTRKLDNEERLRKNARGSDKHT